MFLVGHSITAADILAHAHIALYFGTLPAYEQIQLPHTFRWLDHIQHLPGILEQVTQHGLFVEFPDENAQPPSKGQLKKAAKKGGDMTNPKFLAAQQAKAAKDQAKEESKEPVAKVAVLEESKQPAKVSTDNKPANGGADNKPAK